MKKILALILALAMCASLAACGGEEAPAETTAPAPVETTAPAPAETDAPAEPAGPVYDEVTITLTVSNGEHETGGMLVAYFCDYIEEHSNGAVQMDPYYGGTMCSNSEVLSFVGSGSVDMAMTGTSDFTAELPLINFPGFVYGTQADAVDYASYIAFENEETATLIADELAEQGVVTLGMHAGGANGYFFKTEQTSLKAAAESGLVLGTGMHLACYEAMGFGTATSMPWDTYQELSTGVFDCTTMAIGPAVGMSWCEVAPYILVNNQYSFGNWYIMNIDTWNSLSADTQALFYEAAAASMDYSVELYSTELDAAAAATAAANGSLNYMNEEETAWERDIFFAESYADCMAAAEAAGKTEEMKTVLAAVNEYLGLDLAIG